MSSEVDKRVLEAACREFLLHKGETPWRVTKRGAELWEDYTDAMSSAIQAYLSASPSIGRVGAGTDLAAAFEHEVTQQTQDYEFKTGAKPGTWMFRCSDWIDITAILSTLVYHEEPAGDTQGAAHPDDEAVDRFAAAMKAKLAQKRTEGRGGWEDKDDCSNEFLSELLRGHVLKGDPVDVANFAMMIHQRGERIAALVSPPDNGEAGNG